MIFIDLFIMIMIMMFCFFRIVKNMLKSLLLYNAYYIIY